MDREGYEGRLVAAPVRTATCDDGVTPLFLPVDDAEEDPTPYDRFFANLEALERLGLTDTEDSAEAKDWEVVQADFLQRFAEDVTEEQTVYMSSSVNDAPAKVVPQVTKPTMDVQTAYNDLPARQVSIARGGA